MSLNKTSGESLCISTGDIRRTSLQVSIKGLKLKQLFAAAEYLQGELSEQRLKRDELTKIKRVILCQKLHTNKTLTEAIYRHKCPDVSLRYLVQGLIFQMEGDVLPVGSPSQSDMAADGGHEDRVFASSSQLFILLSLSFCSLLSRCPPPLSPSLNSLTSGQKTRQSNVTHHSIGH